MGVKIHVDTKEVQQIAMMKNMNRSEFALINQVHADMNLYVPKKEGHLRDDSYAQDMSIYYPLSYAKAQFYGGFTTKNGKEVHFTNYTTPGTGKRWDLKAKANHIRAWKQAFLKGGNW
ncbi:minor capsid protein [Melissococcus plutonius]|uniref:Minor capsid protein n=1 Tax=Melissococcus plutonius (strain ATCC 35311 / DSM 29964 / CIP 104052 / LMG 20360 / NCIMB 702443) TaxID=940190 RepID=F3YBG1_MELPT|nr:minor capsid protein [Melissococcus plutonius]KMT33316.1 minor capsid protein [Melissococcus plutonius]KMT33669.1 minor capsid protein [Melissococcus plutonius]KMT38969.1 minor capsid protein [Melissococcus plutonius]MBB5177561.1 hypothetical protein [Melissococcus plutonius]BAK21839.1 minor capsid protein [Melissococcus plutonius ATCC 35311]